ncbi:MAG: CinA family protein [Aeromicrobium sp.]|uniref:CinA family protein n=1 Tax=Aeromicrobium sp. TaxID=1871063 RepID=UPI0039E3CDEB
MGAAGAVALVEELAGRGLSVATAESLTGGLLCSALVDVPGASAVVRGGVVAYAAEVKERVLGVPGSLIERVGTVDAQVARAMAEGVRARLGADLGLSTTGNAGPEPSEGKPVGRVHIAVAAPAGTRDWELDLVGDRGQIRRGAVDAVLSYALATLAHEGHPHGG